MLPPYSSFLTLSADDKNWLIKYPCAPCIWTPVKPDFLAISAAFPKRFIKFFISSFVSSLGFTNPLFKSPWISIALGATDSFATLLGACFPGWFICIHICILFSFPASAHFLSISISLSSSITTFPGSPKACLSIITFPVIRSPVPPFAHFLYKFTCNSFGELVLEFAIPSLIADFKKRFFITAPFFNFNGVNNIWFSIFILSLVIFHYTSLTYLFLFWETFSY